VQSSGDPLSRRRLVCRGVVQGVGFRPAVHKLAHELGLSGFVRNDAEGATIEIQGPPPALAAFEARLPRELPPLARLVHVGATTLPVQQADTAFVVAPSLAGRRGRSLVPADAALCDRCRAELEDPHDRRHRYPFITCTDCGPRFSLVRTLPYDRERTSMACFPLCPACAAEYADPGSRRFHAEPICCPACGPRLWLADASGAELAGPERALDETRQRLASGAIVAVKGLGGFQLACRADDSLAVARLRQQKARPRKPFAVMVRDLGVARELAWLTDVDEDLLASAQGPIVLAPRRPGASVAAAVAPGVGDLGVLLPTTALHVELFRGASFRALVMTSGNRSDEPICLGNREALQRLAGLADGFLLHDRDIVRRVDDSVVRSAPAGQVPVRRSRGFAPLPLPLPMPSAKPLLAVGGHLQTTVCLAADGEAFVSQHIGDLDSETARAFHGEVIAGLQQFLEVAPAVVVCDEHPDYPSTWLAHDFAAQSNARLLTVPHHLAHAAAVLGEHGAFPAPDGSAAALVLDGTGFGPGGAAWGAELLALAGDLCWSRVACGDALPLVGGETAVREPWRIAVAVLTAAGLGDRLRELPLAALVAPDRLAAVGALAERGPWPFAHGAGRLFEAAGALFGLCAHNDYEGEAAACFEALAATWTDDGAPAWPEVAVAAGQGPVPQSALLVAAAQRLLRGEPHARTAFGLHRTYAACWVAKVRRCLPGAKSVALGGGCLVNRLLQQELTNGLSAIGCDALLSRGLPPGDGGLAYGQAVVAAVAIARNCVPSFTPSPEP
jgi:hydrogenase maturation protein HypF